MEPRARDLQDLETQRREHLGRVGPPDMGPPGRSVSWRPRWWDQQDLTAWDRIKEALRRDWEQTKHDLGLAGGHELNQGIVDTIKQAAGAESIPADDRPIPPKVIGAWDEAEYPIGYGYTARRAFGREHPTWNEGLELKLRAEWEARGDKAQRPWDGVKRLVRYGYEYTPKA